MRRWYIWLPISIGLLALLVWRTKPWEALPLASRLDAATLGVAIALNVVVIAGWAERSRSLMAAVGSPLGFGALVPIVSFANTINNITPASSGEVVRAMVLHRRHGVPYPNSAAVIVVERLWAIGILLVTAIAAFVTTINPSVPIAIAAWVIALLAAFAPSLVYLAGLRPGRVARAFAGRGGPHPGRMRKLAGHLAVVDDRLTGVLAHPWRSVHFVVMTAVVFGTYTVQLSLVLQALGTSLPLVGVWAALGLAICAGALSALPFGLGATDVVLVILLGAQGVDATVAGAAALLLRVVTTLPLGLVGTACWIHVNRPIAGALARPAPDEAEASRH